MAAIHYIKPHLAGAEDFRINGHSPLGSNDSTTYFAQAHGVLAFMSAAMAEMAGSGGCPVNPTITAEAIYGVQTLLTLGLVSQENEQAARRAA